MKILAYSLVYPDTQFAGQVISIDTRLDPVTRSVQVRAVLPNQDSLLKPGMFMRVDLQRDRGPVLVAPEKSIVPERGAQFVYRVEDGTAMRQRVTLGRRIPGLVEIVSGLKAGDVIITEGTHKVREGSAVEVVEQRATNTAGHVGGGSR